MDINDTKDKVYGSVFGATIGDALGAPTENLTTDYIIKLYGGPITDYTEPKNYLMGEIKKGQWTDDTEQSFFIIDSLDNNGININKFVNCLIRWKNSNPPDIGPTTYRAILKLEDGDFSGINNSSCGAAMKVYPLGIAYYNNLKKLKEEVIKVSKITHNNKTAIAGALSVAFFVSKGFCGIKNFNLLNECYNYINSINSDFGEIILEIKRFKNKSVSSLFKYFGTGLPTEEVVPSAIGSYLLTDSFKDNIINCVNIGGDTDSLACISGGISGAYYGYRHIFYNCNKWIEGLLNRGVVIKYCEKLLHFLKNK